MGSWVFLAHHWTVGSGCYGSGFLVAVDAHLEFLLDLDGLEAGVELLDELDDLLLVQGSAAVLVGRVEHFLQPPVRTWVKENRASAAGDRITRSPAKCKRAHRNQRQDVSKLHRV